jgi:protein-tyrosine phosphatase
MADHRRVRICFVCSGNICRSPIAEVVLRAQVQDAGLADRVDVDSAGTGDWHIGERADHRAVRVLATHGYDGTTHRARQFDPAWFPTLDLVIALDAGHARTLRSWAPDEEQRAKVRLLGSFAAGTDGGGRPVDLDIRDPYYDGPEAFEEILGQIESACAGLTDRLPGLLASPAGEAGRTARPATW